VIRRWTRGYDAATDDVDKLSLTHRRNETVYSRLTPADVRRILACHLEEDRPCDEATTDARARTSPPRSAIEGRIRALRARRRG
jgi:(2Fe-2S) ferredoxin